MDKQLQYIKEYELDIIMEYLGYEYDNKKSTKTSKKYKDNLGNIFIVKSNTYFNTFDNNDNGTTIDFIQNHIIKERNFYKVKIWFSENIENLNNVLLTEKSYKQHNNYKDNYKKKDKKQDRQKGKENSFNVLYQKIYKNKINKKDIRKINIELFNYLINEEIIKYYIKYDLLKIPLKNSLNTDITGILNININNSNKFLEKGSKKDLFILNTTGLHKYILLFESFFDLLSYIELLKIKHKTSYTEILYNTIFISSNGSLSINNKESIKNIITNINTIENIVLCFDNDKIGIKYDNEIKELLQPLNIPININKSITKDYNEDLQMYYKQQYNKQYIDNVIDIYNFELPF